jgi:transposase
MSKFSSLDKLDAVNRYINGIESYRDIGKSIGIDHKSIVKWVRQFKNNGFNAFMNKCTTYTSTFKLEVLNYMAEHGTSLCETAAIFNIPAHSTVANWKMKLETSGIGALRSNKERDIPMKNKANKQTNHNSTKGSVKELEDRIKQLEMENEYLKKLNALVQSKEKSTMKTKRK